MINNIIDFSFIYPDLTVSKGEDACVNTMNSQPSKLVNSAFQFIFDGYTAFTFPAAHYPVKGVSSEI